MPAFYESAPGIYNSQQVTPVVSAAAYSAGNDVPAFDHDPATLAPLGIGLWQQVTNCVRNNTMVGAAAGTPGTLPTNWSQGKSTNLSWNVVGIGAESGIPYIDLQVVGTATAGAIDLWFETPTGMPALTAQTWTNAFFCKLVAGSFTNVALPTPVWYEETSGAAFVTGGFGAALSPAAIALAAQRFSAQRTLSGGATVAAILAGVEVVLSAGAVNLTLRIGAPSVTQTSFTPPVILTSGTPATRAADSCVMTPAAFAKYVNPAGGTAFVDTMAPTEGTANNLSRVFSFSDVGYTNYLEIYNNGGSYYLNETGAGASWLATPSNGQSVRYGAEWSSGRAIGSGSGVISTQMLGAVPPFTSLYLGNRPDGARSRNGYIQRIALYPSPMPDAQFQSLSNTVAALP